MARRDLGIDGTEDGEPRSGSVEASRRRFLSRTAGGAVAFGAATISLSTLARAAFAQTSGGGTTVPGTTPGSTPGSGPPTTTAGEPPTVSGTDLELTQLVLSLELAAEVLYDAFHDNGKLDPPATQQARTFQLHHGQHTERLKEFSGNQSPTVGNQALVDELLPQIDAATTQVQLAEIGTGLENGLAATYQWALEQVEEWELAALFATILPVDGQQSVAWSRTAEPDLAAWAAQVDTFVPVAQSTAGFYDPSRYPVTPA